MQKPLKIVLIIVGVVISLFIIFILSDFKTTIYNYFSGVSEAGYKMPTYQLLNLMVIFSLMAISAILGNYISKKKKRNQTLWTVLCFIFNIWAVVTLWFLPISTKRRIGSENE